MLTYVNFNLFYSPAQALVNTVNTVGVMGKGIAAEFKELYPDMYKEYRRLCKQGKLDVGRLHIYRTPNKIIVNFPTKKHWRQRSRVEYIDAGLRKFVTRYSDYGISSVSFPQLGCGNGELDWEAQVQPVMEHYLRNLPIPVYVHLYPSPPDFIPERLDPDYAREMRKERQRPSADQVWNDLHDLIHRQPQQLSFFGPTVEISEEHLLFSLNQGEAVIVYRQDIEDLWNVLRLRGTLHSEDVPEPLREDGVTEWLFDLLVKLDYIRPVELRRSGRASFERGLRYAPLPVTLPTQQVEIVV